MHAFQGRRAAPTVPNSCESSLKSASITTPMKTRRLGMDEEGTNEIMGERQSIAVTLVTPSHCERGSDQSFDRIRTLELLSGSTDFFRTFGRTVTSLSLSLFRFRSYLTRSIYCTCTR